VIRLSASLKSFGAGSINTPLYYKRYSIINAGDSLQISKRKKRKKIIINMFAAKISRLTKDD